MIIKTSHINNHFLKVGFNHDSLNKKLTKNSTRDNSVLIHRFRNIKYVVHIIRFSILGNCVCHEKNNSISVFIHLFVNSIIDTTQLKLILKHLHNTATMKLIVISTALLEEIPFTATFAQGNQNIPSISF